VAKAKSKPPLATCEQCGQDVPSDDNFGVIIFDPEATTDFSDSLVVCSLTCAHLLVSDLRREHAAKALRQASRGLQMGADDPELVLPKLVEAFYRLHPTVTVAKFFEAQVMAAANHLSEAQYLDAVIQGLRRWPRWAGHPLVKVARTRIKKL
jgi:hypothetical protein